MRNTPSCVCEDGWEGINCNVCKTNDACNAMMPEKKGGVCYQNGEVVNENYQMCDVTNVKIVDLLGDRRPQVTFTCNADKETCDFQCGFPYMFWRNALISKSLGGTTRILLLLLGYVHLKG